MDKKTTGMIATIAAVVLCGCPGLFMCFLARHLYWPARCPVQTLTSMGSNDPGMLPQ